MACVVAPGLHTQDTPAEAVNVTEPPAQNVVGPLGVMVATGNGFTVTAIGADTGEEHPLASVTVTE